eukprot:1018904-Rhodomonas_salina.3
MRGLRVVVCVAMGRHGRGEDAETKLRLREHDVQVKPAHPDLRWSRVLERDGVREDAGVRARQCARRMRMRMMCELEDDRVRRWWLDGARGWWYSNARMMGG